MQDTAKSTKKRGKSREDRIRAGFLKLLAASAPVLLLDQASKALISSRMRHGVSIPVMEDVFHLTLVHNTGAVFGLFRGMNVLLILSSAAFLAVFLYAYPELERSRPGFWRPAGLIAGGAAGNMMDRLRMGYVIDFLDFRIWPVFNFADAAITAGIALGLWFILSGKRG